jgi:hypothetical protein
MDRLNMDDIRAAQYLGVPVYTLRKWVKGERTPNAATLRLLEVLGLIEAIAPAIHAALLPGEIEHVKKSGLKRSTDSPGKLNMSKNPD